VARRWHPYLRGELVIVIDCADLDRAAEFWCSVLGFAQGGRGNATYRSLVPAGGDGIEVLLQRVPDAKAGKNRVHLDLRTDDLVAETSRVVALGARQLTSEPISEDGLTWHVLADPDDNEFCVLAPTADGR
jgi:predicted enzyme related to lactoylglutathione lyase